MSRFSHFLSVVLLALISTLALADPPAQVGRLAWIENTVDFQVDADDPGAPASINWPVSSGAVLNTGRRGRSEVWIGSTAFRLAPESRLEFPVVDDRQVEVRLASGTLAVSILDRAQSADISVLTPEGRIRFTTPGRYRIDVLADHSELTAQAGQARFIDEQGSIPVLAGKKARFFSDGQMRLDPDFAADAFDNWVAERENGALDSTSQRYVSPAMTGYQDLDNYGDWNTTAEYGAVWYPRTVDDDWAPYRFGRWAWVAPWGWTWIDPSPWGFAPFHYGRWVYVHNRWGWVPGSYVARPVYAPALVAWIGNPGWNVSFRTGAAPAVGWFPLAPHEAYVPGFQASAQFVHRLNGGHVGNAGEIDRAVRSGAPHAFAYRALPQAVTIIPSRQFGEGRPIRAGEFARHDGRALERAPQARSTPDPALVPPALGRRAFSEQSRQPSVPGRNDQGRPGNFAPQPAVAPDRPVPARRAPDGLFGQAEHRSPQRSPEIPRNEPESRGRPIVVPTPAPLGRPAEPRVPAPAAAPSVERGAGADRQGRAERRSANPPVHAAGPEIRRQEAPRQEYEMPRQGEPLRPVPQAMRQMPRPAAQSAPVREAPRAEPRSVPQVQPQAAPQGRGGQNQRHESREERGQR